MAPGILGGAPLSPYPSSGGMISFLFSPIHMLRREIRQGLVKLISLNESIHWNSCKLDD
jgi:hypothetical protein